MKVIFNYATRQFEPMEPTLRDRFALGGGVIQGEKVGDRENFNKPILKPSVKIRNFLRKKYPNINFNFDEYPIYGLSSNDPNYPTVSSTAKYNFSKKFKQDTRKQQITKNPERVGGQAAFGERNKLKFFKVFDEFLAGEFPIGASKNYIKKNPDTKQASPALQTLMEKAGIKTRFNARKFLNQHPWYKKNKAIYKYATSSGIAKNFVGKTLPELLDVASLRIGNVTFKDGKLLQV